MVGRLGGHCSVHRISAGLSSGLSVNRENIAARSAGNRPLSLMLCLPGCDVAGYSVGWPQRDVVGARGLAGWRRELEVPYQRGERDHRFEHREMLADAGPGSTSEREPRVAMPGLLLPRGEPLRVEALRLFPECRVPVGDPGCEHDVGAR